METIYMYHIFAGKVYKVSPMGNYVKSVKTLSEAEDFVFTNQTYSWFEVSKTLDDGSLKLVLQVNHC